MTSSTDPEGIDMTEPTVGPPGPSGVSAPGPMLMHQSPTGAVACALCVRDRAFYETKPYAQTMVGPLPVCGGHVDAALAMVQSPPRRDLCDASMATPRSWPVPGSLIGPCILRHDHDGPVHKDADGTKWSEGDQP